MTIPKQPALTCYDNTAKQTQSRKIRSVYRQAAKLLSEFKIEVRFNPGGIAVWGETYAKIYARRLEDYTFVTPSQPVVEAYDTSMGLLVRQWDGRNSGANHYVQTLEQFVSLARELASRPFVRF